MGGNNTERIARLLAAQGDGDGGTDAIEEQWSAPPYAWKDDSIQFPRLLSEIAATQDLDMEALAESMDLEVADVNELFDRADRLWELAKGRAR